MAHEPPPTHAALRAALRAELEELRAAGRLRVRPVLDSADDRVVIAPGPGGRRKLHNWASNDYLGAANRLRVKNAAARALRTYGAGAGAARLLAGGLRCHRRLEERLAGWLGAQDVLVTTTGYQANLAALVALASGAEDVVILDRLCHASLYDGAKLANGTMLRFQHNDLEDLDKQLRRTTGAPRRLVCVESVYSMDGDEAPLAGIAELCQRHGALLLVDEDHALGVFGPGGRGLCAALGVVPDVLIGTCSKSLGAQGGFIAADTRDRRAGGQPRAQLHVLDRAGAGGDGRGGGQPRPAARGAGSARAAARRGRRGARRAARPGLAGARGPRADHPGAGR